MCLVLKWFCAVNSNIKKKFCVYIFRIIAHSFDLEGYLLWFDTASVNKGVISAAVNCSHMHPVNPTLLTILTLRCLQLKFYFYYAAWL